MEFVTPQLFTEAVKKLGSRSPIGSTLSSAEWSAVPVAIRERSQFSSKIAEVRFLQDIQSTLTDFFTAARETFPDGSSRLKVGSRAKFVELLQARAAAYGLGDVAPELVGGLQDPSSERRLALIFDVQVRAARDFGNWKQGMDPAILNAFPAQRFVREIEVASPRPIHQQNEGVVRLKTDLRFWLAMNAEDIGGFGVPWGPWGFNSGMGVEDVERDEAESLGLLSAADQLVPIERDLNDHLAASLTNVDPHLADWLIDQLAGKVHRSGARLIFTPNLRLVPPVIPAP
jgi:hypothetical protein